MAQDITFLPFGETLAPKEPEPIDIVEQQPVSFEELARWNELIGNEYSTCGQSLIVKTCSKHGTNHYCKKMYSRCNKRKLCPRCAWFYARREALLMYDYLTQNLVSKLKFSVYITQLVLTLPPEFEGMSNAEFSKKVRDLLLDKKNKLTEKEYIQREAKLQAFYRKKMITKAGLDTALASLQQMRKLERAYCYVIQDQSSETPFLPHKHVHVLLLNVGLLERENKQGGLEWKTADFVRFSPWMDVNKLRRDWNVILGRDNGAPVDIHASYASWWSKGKILHWLAYMYRYECWDMFKFVIRRSGEFSDTMADGSRQTFMFTLDTSTDGLNNRALIRKIIEAKKNRVTWCGFMSPNRRKVALALDGLYLGLDYLRERSREAGKLCTYRNLKGELCGAELIEIKNLDPEKDIKEQVAKALATA